MITLNRSAASFQAEIAALRKRAITLVNAEIGEVRKDYITDIPGQQMIYVAKEKEAAAFLGKDPAPMDLTPYPFIAGEIGPTGENASQVAQVYVNLAAFWRQVGSELEQLRLGTIAGIGAATDQTGIDAILAGFRETAELYRNV